MVRRNCVTLWRQINCCMDSKENSDINNIDPQIKSDYDLIMKDCPELISSQWEMVGENYKQFSLYETYYETKVSNCIQI